MKEFSLADILGGLREKFSKGSSLKEKIQNVLLKHITEEIPSSAILVRGKVLFVTLPPVVKHELSFKKEAILGELRQEGFFFEDIR